MKRVSKISNLDASFTTPPLPPRPASYTPSTQESLSVLAKFDTVRSYGSAAEDLESNSLRYGGQLFQNISTHKSSHVSVPPSLTPPPPSSSDSDSLLKAGWDTDLNSSKEKIYEDKIQNSKLSVHVSFNLVCLGLYFIHGFNLFLIVCAILLIILFLISNRVEVGDGRIGG